MIWALLGAALISIIGSVATTAANNKAVKDANDQSFQNSVDLYEMQSEDARENAQVEREYTSPANQASLMRQAGLNPDLQNVNFNSSGAASTPSASAPQVQPLNYSTLSQAVGNAISSAVSMGSQVQGLQQGAIQLDNSRLAQYFGYDNELLSILGIPDVAGSKAGDSNTALWSQFGSIPGLRKSTANALKNRILDLAKSDRGKSIIMGNVNDYESGVESWRTRNANPLYKTSFGLEDSVLEFYREMYGSVFSKNKYDRQYYNTLDSNGQASLLNETTFNERSKQSMLRTITRLFKQHVDKGDFVGSNFFFSLYMNLVHGQNNLVTDGISGLGSALGGLIPSFNIAKLLK